MHRRPLPIGIQTFREIREEGCCYIDKTTYARRLADDAGKHYFLSRPRRFGKSLFVDTLKELYEGAEGLFRGLDVHGAWDWSRRHPVVRLSFGGGNFKRPDELRASVLRQLDAAESRARPGPFARLLDAVRARPPAPPRDGPAPGRLAALLETLHRRSGRRVVVPVDEYDKPILDALDEPEQARLHRGGRGPGVRAGAAGPGPGRDPRLVRRLRLAGRGAGLQPVRAAEAVPQPALRGPLVRDRHADVPGGHPDRPRRRRLGSRRRPRQRGPAVDVRRGGHRGRGAAVADGLPHHAPDPLDEVSWRKLRELIYADRGVP